MNEKKKNFLLLGIIAVVTILFVFYMNFWFEQKNKNAESLSAKNLFEIKQNDFDNYIVDNSDAIIYMARGNDTTLRNFEQKFIQLIKDNELSKEIVYLNTDEVNKQFYQDLKEYYNDSLKDENPTLSARANILIIKDRKIVDILYTKNKQIQEDDVQEFFKENDVIE